MRFILALPLCWISPAWSISNDANPWLALEHAACAAHLVTDYSREIEASVSLTAAVWRGASNGLPTHCHVTGTLEGKPVDLRLPTVWTGQVYDNCEVLDVDLQSILNASVAVAFTASTAKTRALLNAMVVHHYPEAKAPGFKPVPTCQ